MRRGSCSLSCRGRRGAGLIVVAYRKRRECRRWRGHASMRSSHRVRKPGALTGAVRAGVICNRRPRNAPSKWRRRAGKRMSHGDIVGICVNVCSQWPVMSEVEEPISALQRWARWRRDYEVRKAISCAGRGLFHLAINCGDFCGAIIASRIFVARGVKPVCLANAKSVVISRISAASCVYGVCLPLSW